MLRVYNGMLVWDTFGEMFRAMFTPMTAELERKLIGQTAGFEDTSVWTDSFDEESDGFDAD